MNDSPFVVGGALAADSPVYVQREADQIALNNLKQMNYITLVEPRQQGKTSLINNLIGKLKDQNYSFALIDFGVLDQTTEKDWYNSLYESIVRQLNYLPNPGSLSRPYNGFTWYKFLDELSQQTENNGKYCVLALDEVGAAKVDWATQFFSVIRSLYNSRETMTAFKHLTFIVAGAYNPKNLIDDSNISNFNVDHRIPLADFTLENANIIVNHLDADCDFAQIAERVHYWSGGQPYMTQKLCDYLTHQNPPITEASVDTAVEKFIQDDTNHLPRIKKDLEADPELENYVKEILRKKTMFAPSVNEWQFNLAHVIGMISTDSRGLCVIRNHIYERVFSDIIKPVRLRYRRRKEKINSRPLQMITGLILYSILFLITTYIISINVIPFLQPVIQWFTHSKQPLYALILLSAAITSIIWILLWLVFVKGKIIPSFLHIDQSEQIANYSSYIFGLPSIFVFIFLFGSVAGIFLLKPACYPPPIALRDLNNERMISPNEIFSAKPGSTLIIEASSLDNSQDVLSCKWTTPDEDLFTTIQSSNCTTTIEINNIERVGTVSVEMSKVGILCNASSSSTIEISTVP